MKNLFDTQKIKLLFSIVLILVLSNCSSHPPNSSTQSVNKIFKPQSNSDTYRAKQLNQFYKQWKGVPYQYGGMSKKGIDCSGFTHIAYKQIFGQYIPRVTHQQNDSGKVVNRENLKIADLVFFKTSKKVWHVGIYLGNNQFMHASTSIGVTISDLDNSYWSPRYRFARRIFK